jgi:hypothetical protein
MPAICPLQPHIYSSVQDWPTSAEALIPRPNLMHVQNWSKDTRMRTAYSQTIQGNCKSRVKGRLSSAFPMMILNRMHLAKLQIRDRLLLSMWLSSSTSITRIQLLHPLKSSWVDSLVHLHTYHSKSWLFLSCCQLETHRSMRFQRKIHNNTLKVTTE